MHQTSTQGQFHIPQVFVSLQLRRTLNPNVLPRLALSSVPVFFIEGAQLSGAGLPKFTVAVSQTTYHCRSLWLKM